MDEDVGRRQVESELFVARLAASAEVIAALVKGVEPDQAQWKPAADEWSILEVVNHLYDEEREDFRQRLRLLLADPTQDWPRNDPVGWVTERGYNTRELGQSLANFLAEREASLLWLRSLSDVNWDTTRHHHGFSLRAGDLLAAWVAHDLVHVRQLADLHRAYVDQIAAPYQTEYAD